MERITVEGKGSLSSHEHPKYPYAEQAPFNEIWITGADFAYVPGGNFTANPSIYGTLGEFVDAQIEASEMSPDEVGAILHGIMTDGQFIVPGFVGCGLLLRRALGPEEAILMSAAPAP